MFRSLDRYLMIYECGAEPLYVVKPRLVTLGKAELLYIY